MNEREVIDENFEKKRLVCRCVPYFRGCLFCDPELILHDVPNDEKKKLKYDVNKEESS